MLHLPAPACCLSRASPWFSTVSLQLKGVWPSRLTPLPGCSLLAMSGRWRSIKVQLTLLPSEGSSLLRAHCGAGWGLLWLLRHSLICLWAPVSFPSPTGWSWEHCPANFLHTLSLSVRFLGTPTCRTSLLPFEALGANRCQFRVTGMDRVLIILLFNLPSNAEVPSVVLIFDYLLLECKRWRVYFITLSGRYFEALEQVYYWVECSSM